MELLTESRQECCRNGALLDLPNNVPMFLDDNIGIKTMRCYGTVTTRGNKQTTGLGRNIS